MANYTNTRTKSKTILRVKDECSTLIVTQIEFDLHSNQNVYLLSNGDRVPEKYIKLFYNEVKPLDIPHVKFKTVEGAGMNSS